MGYYNGKKVYFNNYFNGLARKKVYKAILYEGSTPSESDTIEGNTLVLSSANTIDGNTLVIGNNDTISDNALVLN